MIVIQTGYLTAHTSGGSIICSGLLQGDAVLETKGNGVSDTLLYVCCGYSVVLWFKTALRLFLYIC